MPPSLWSELLESVTLAASAPPVPIIIDTDLAMGVPGSDVGDGYALALALADPDIQVRAITCVHGNADVDSVVLLSKEILDRLRHRHVPVYRGASTPLCASVRHREAFPTLAEQFGHHTADAGPAAARIAELVAAHPGEITIVAIGPLTNVATAIDIDPDLPALVREIVIVGGQASTTDGDPPELNFSTDPAAAAAVLGSGAPIRVLGHDVTARGRLRRDEAAVMSIGGNSFERYAGRHTMAWIDHLGTVAEGTRRGATCALHDPVAVAVLTRPELVRWEPAHVTATDASPLNGDVDASPNALLARALDVPGYLAHLFAAIEGLDAKD